MESRRENAVAAVSATPAVEYLLVGEDPTRPSGDLERVAEEGSRTAEEHAEAGFDEAVTLYNSVSLADGAPTRRREGRGRRELDPRTTSRDENLRRALDARSRRRKHRGRGMARVEDSSVHLPGVRFHVPV